MKIAVTGVVHETNTFAPGVTDLDDFSKNWFEDKQSFISRFQETRTSMGAVIDYGQAEGIEIVPSFYTEAMPSGIITSDAVNVIIDKIVNSIEPSNVDGILVILHGAMVSENILDVEGEILARLRVKVGYKMPVAITLDLHANISDAMVKYSDIIVGYDTYPHIDIYERAKEAVELLIKYIQGEINPVSVLAKADMLVVPQAMVTEEPPMKELMDKAFEIEEDTRVLNVTVAGGFPYSDIDDAGMTLVVTTDGDEKLARQYAHELKSFVLKKREKFNLQFLSPREAVKTASQYPESPVILVEGSDNVGGGAPADATHVLKCLKEVDCKSLIVIRDKESVLKANEIGVGKYFSGYIGGKTDDLHGDPVYIEGKVKTLFCGEYSHVGPYMTGKKVSMGLSAVIESDTITAILTEERVAPWDLGHVSSVGLNPKDFQIIVVKSAVAWKSAFGAIAKLALNVDSPGCCAINLKHLKYKNLKRPKYPLDL